MKDILQKIQSVYESIVQKEAQITQLLSSVTARETAVAEREKFCSEYESAKAVLDAVAESRRQVNVASEQLEEEKVKFENRVREEKQALAKEEARLAPLQDLERQLAKEKAALDVEKTSFKARYIEKIKQHFLNAKGAPNLDEIT